MSEALFGLWEEVRPAFSEAGPWERARTLGMSLLTCLGRHTVTGLLTTSGQQEVDWSAAYRLFGDTHFDLEALWGPVRRGALALLGRSGGPVVAALDDTLLPRWGRKVVGASWRRDPLGPRFQTNLVWAQRMLQTTLLVPEGPGASRARPPGGSGACPYSPSPPPRSTRSTVRRSGSSA